MATAVLEMGDVLDAPADSVLIPIDGQMRVPSERLDRVLGNIGRQFIRRYPDAQFLEEFDSQVLLPLPLGSAAAVELTGGPFRFAVVVSTLHHGPELSDTEKRRAVRMALARALDAVVGAGGKSVATGVLQGGWRLPAQVALHEMLASIAGSDSRAEVTIRLLDMQLLSGASALARGLGLMAATSPSSDG